MGDRRVATPVSLAAVVLVAALLAPPAPGADAVPSAKPRAAETAPPSKGSRKQRPRVLSEKEAEGSEAADRFESETVRKSRYTHEGQSLEVDPD